MKSLIKSARTLQHPGFVVFEGLDFTGKTFLAKHAAKALSIDPRFQLNVIYNHNHGFLNKNVVNKEYLKELGANGRFNYLLDCYKKDTLSSDSKDFIEIFQDRHFPYLAFYAITQTGKKIDEIIPLFNNLTKPKHIFLIECSYEERKRRALQKNHVKPNELLSLASRENHTSLINLYRSIITSFNIPSTIVDTTSLNVEKLIPHFLEILQQKDILTHNLRLEELVVDEDPHVFKSTAAFKLQELLKGIIYPPINVIRKIDSSKNYAGLIKDGRHRAYVALKAGKKIIPAYVNYKFVDNIPASALKLIQNFTFKGGDLGLNYVMNKFGQQ